MTKKTLYYMPEWSAIQEWAFDYPDSPAVYTDNLCVGLDNWSYQQMYEEALISARDDSDPDDIEIEHVHEYYDGYCIFTYDGLKQWAKGNGLPLVFGGFGKNDDERNDNAKKVEEAIINFCNISNFKFSMLENEYAQILLDDAKPKSNGRLFMGDKSYSSSDLDKIISE
tara:strand:+ start:183 stop:689 length:507 start_codon:yes stop_codon:yes gene_type:complete